MNPLALKLPNACFRIRKVTADGRKIVSPFKDHILISPLINFISIYRTSVCKHRYLTSLSVLYEVKKKREFFKIDVFYIY